MDNASSHKELDLSNIKVIFLTPNLTSVLQPMDAGIIKSFKSHYKKILCRFFLNTIELHNKLERPNVKQAIYMVVEAWDEVKKNTVKNCWRHVNILNKEIEEEEVNDKFEHDECKKDTIELLNKLFSEYYCY